MIYFNNAATSWPKFPSTLAAIKDALANGQVYCGRDTADFLGTEKTLFDLRENLGKILHASKPYEICFASSSTVALDELVLGRAEFLRSVDKLDGGFILCSDCEHNSVMRPLQHLKDRYGVPFVPVRTMLGKMTEESIAEAIREGEALGRKPLFAVFSHASNVTGDVLNAGEVGLFLEKKGIPLILDVTQSIGIAIVDVESSSCSAAAFAGHKGLNGPQGTGGFYIREGFDILPILFGGTGHASSSIDPPVAIPDSFEVGTPPVHDLIGLANAVGTLLSMHDGYKKKILGVTQYCRDEVAKIKGYRVFGSQTKESPIFSFVTDRATSSAVASALWDESRVNCRSGLLCSPMGVHALGCDSVVRFSFGFYNTMEEADAAVGVLRRL